MINFKELIEIELIKKKSTKKEFCELLGYENSNKLNRKISSNSLKEIQIILNELDLKLEVVNK